MSSPCFPPLLTHLIVPVNDLAGDYDYPPEKRFEIAEQDLPPYLRAADFPNRNDTSKYSDRTAVKSAMTGVAGFLRTHLERPNPAPAKQHRRWGLHPISSTRDQGHPHGGNHA